jgi:hypothetical protein
MKKRSKIASKAEIRKAVSTSSAIEGQSLNRAKKNQSVIGLLKQYGRGFSV